MEVKEVIYRRRSIRAFTPAPIPKKTLMQLIGAAIQAPSARNIQPWQFIVVTGKARARLAHSLLTRYEQDLAQGRQLPAIELPEPYQARARRFTESLAPAAVHEPTFDLIRGSLNFYGAPAVILLALDRRLSPDRLFDVGAAAQNLLLMAEAQGLSTCVIGLVLWYQDLIRQELQLPESVNLITTIALGIPDRTSPLFDHSASREDAAEFLTWID
ncbi:nitroreductase [Desulfobacca acetoxidans]|jgi:nitroreductase|uniref:Nitroreductase n=1 Tax=Desulfobacca acetoxidans (strain ATCC 700848 / DSM 11109 / ASRB2) TaxID=880072 RepID=F2NCI3_DESAR|nr:nitroreductase [Desulfobacca acetoxidans]AEB09117.1 nitroreductase [Desulfobacca acetoxidans DSM 11109]HAY22320.1 hypothetical protein [Desulfobacterales bacterium]